MFDDFSHFLAYGSTDQETLRDLTDAYQGLIVPGTIAAYQAEGTRGFVLSLSAAIGKPYAIDPRTPLFQYRNAAPKQSHLALAKLLGLADLVETNGLVALSDWTEDRVAAVARDWIAFNTSYTTIAPKQFDKYARRLGRALPVSKAATPRWILSPYLMDTGEQGMRAANNLLWTAMQEEARLKSVQLRRVFAHRRPDALADEVLESPEEEVVIWLDDLDEMAPESQPRLSAYASAVRDIARAGKAPFALYGGYFATALRSFGLRGVSHGIGFSEHRNHIELRSSGGAPARFYVQRLHRYLPVEIASELWRQNPSLVESYFAGYESRDPGEYSYHDLMKLSVRARWDEANRLEELASVDVIADLQQTLRSYQADLARVSLSEAVTRRVRASLQHLSSWIGALTDAKGGA